MKHSDSRVSDPKLAATDKPSGGGTSEDWWATLVGIALILIALLGFVPQTVLW